MRGTERGPNGTLRYFYCYKEGGTKYYYNKQDHGQMRIPFRKPYIPREPEPDGYYDRPPPMEYREYVPGPKLSNMEQQFQRLHPNIQKLITTWMLVFGFVKLDDITADAVTKAFRKLSLIHHPDKGGSLEKYQELSSVKDHLTTLCTMAQAMR